MSLFKKKEKEVVPDEVIIKEQREKTAQQWMPIANVDNNIIYRKDSTLVGMLKIIPDNLDLLNDREKRRKVEALAEGLNGEKDTLQFFCIGRPVDLNNYIEGLIDKSKKELDFKRKAVLKGYIQQASRMASSGDTMERRFYLILTKVAENKAERELLERLDGFKVKLSKANLVTTICNEDECMDVLALFSNPVQSAVERTYKEYDLAPILEM